MSLFWVDTHYTESLMIFTGFYTKGCCVSQFNIFCKMKLAKRHHITSFLIRFISQVFFFLLCASNVSASASAYDKGAFYFARGEYLSALTLWKPLANEGNSAALYSIGLLYDQGKGVKKDTQIALTYLQAAVDKNLPVAQYYLGMKYYAGLNIKKDASKAWELLEKAAKNEYLPAQFQLANFYNTGEGGVQNQPLATHWFSKAAENGLGSAQHSLATRFLTGKGVTLNLERGIFWLEKAAEQNDSDAMRDLGFMYFKGMGVKKNFSKARDLLLIPAEENSGLSQFLLGEIYTTGGDGIPKDLRQAKKWFKLSKKSGYKEAYQRLQQFANGSRIQTKKHEVQLVQKKVYPIKQDNTLLTAQSLSSKSSNSQLTQHALRFKQLNGNYYLLQIITAKQYDSIHQLTKIYMDDLTYFFKIKKGEEHFYVLTYGYYPSYAEAKQAIINLPKAFQQKSKPWIRQVKDLQTSVL